MSRFIEYFAYGSNLSYARLAARIGRCAVLGTAELRGFRLEFHKRGADGSAKCNAHRTDYHADSVLGVIYVISEVQKSVLDRYEGVGFGLGFSVLLADPGAPPGAASTLAGTISAKPMRLA